MTIKKQFLNDKRFHVARQDADRIFEEDIYNYKICKIKICFIKKGIKGKIISLYQTESYKLLNNKIDVNQYNNYCKEGTHKYEKHSIESFNQLINDFEEYDIKKGAIVIDQFGLIRDGQHRASILLKKYGPNYKVDVVKVYYKGLRAKIRIKLFFKMVRDICKNY